MGFFDKVKNMFTEEVEDDDVKVEKIKKEVTHVAIESPNAQSEEKDYDADLIKFEINQKDNDYNNRPVFFDDNDFNDLNLTDKKEKEKDEIVKEKEPYGSKITIDTKSKDEKKIFKPTPIISPVYGILDKNYHKEDIVSRNETKVVQEIKEPSIDSIRNKAYGTLEDELENTLFGNNSILFKNDDSKEEVKEISDDVLSNLTDDISKELDELLIKKEKYSEEEFKKKINKDENIDEEDLLGFIDSTLYKEGDEN